MLGLWVRFLSGPGFCNCVTCCESLATHLADVRERPGPRLEKHIYTTVRQARVGGSEVRPQASATMRVAPSKSTTVILRKRANSKAPARRGAPSRAATENVPG